MTVRGRAGATLTLKEFELLRFLMENRGMAFTREKLLERVWDLGYGGGTRTVDVWDLGYGGGRNGAPSEGRKGTSRRCARSWAKRPRASRRQHD